MSARISLQARANDYLAERRHLGFELKSMGLVLASFAHHVAAVHHQGALTVDLMAQWARHDKCNRGTAQTWARRLKLPRPFTRYLRQFEPRTEVPDESVFGPVPGRVAPHIYREEEIVDLLAAARELRPHGSLRPATFERCSVWIASAGLRCPRRWPCSTPMST
jgi:site-specific recombinase XerD